MNEGRDRSGSDGGAYALGEDSGIRITSILETNSLLIQASQSEYNAVLAAIERIELLKDGASAIYGADAVAGADLPRQHREHF